MRPLCMVLGACALVWLGVSVMGGPLPAGLTVLVGLALGKLLKRST